MKTTLNPFENAKRTANGTGGGVSPAVIEEMQAEISTLGSQNETQAQDIIDIKGSLNSINDNLSWKQLIPKKTFTNDYSDFQNIEVSNYSEIAISYGCDSGATVINCIPIIALNSLYYDSNLAVCALAGQGGHTSSAKFEYSNGKISLKQTYFDTSVDTVNSKTMAIYYR